MLVMVQVVEGLVIADGTLGDDLAQDLAVTEHRVQRRKRGLS